MRALLDLMRENETAVQGVILKQCQILPCSASSSLNILEPELGEKDLIESVAALQVQLQGLVK